MKQRLLIVSLLLLIAPLLPAQTAQTHYVSDALETPLRSGASWRNRIIRMVPSGAALTVLQTSPEKDFTLVRTPDGAQGWIASRDLTDTPSARDRLASLQQQLDKATAENNALKKQLNAIMAHGGDAQASFSQLVSDNERLSQELAELRKIHSGAVDLSEQNRSLQERVVNLEREIQITQQENQLLANNNDNNMFLAGASILLLGMFLGVALPRMRWKRRQSWGEL